MSDEIYKKIRESHNKNELPLYHESAWNSFEQYAKERDRPKAVSWYTWGIGALILLLISTNAIWWNKMSSVKNATIIEFNEVTGHLSNSMLESDSKNSQEAIANLELLIKQQQSIDELVKNVKQLKVQLATLSISKRTAGTKSKLIHPASKEIIINNSRLEVINNDERSQGAIETFGPSKDYDNSQFKALKGDGYNLETLKSKPSFWDSELSKLSHFALLPLDITKQMPIGQAVIFLNPKAKNTSLDFMMPKSLSANLEGGFTAISHKELGYSSGLNIGIGLSTTFSRHVRLVAIVKILSTSAEVDIEHDQAFSILTGSILPRGSKLEELYYDYAAIGISTGLDYMFKPNGRIKPYVGISYLLQFAHYKNLFLEYNSNNQSLVQLLPKRDLPMTQFIGIRGGLDFTLFENLDASLNLSIQKNLNNESQVLFNFSPGIHYHF